MYVLAKLAERYDAESYGSLVRKALGRKTSAIQAAVMIIYLWGSSLSYLVRSNAGCIVQAQHKQQPSSQFQCHFVAVSQLLHAMHSYSCSTACIYSSTMASHGWQQAGGSGMPAALLTHGWLSGCCLLVLVHQVIAADTFTSVSLLYFGPEAPTSQRHVILFGTGLLVLCLCFPKQLQALGGLPEPDHSAVEW
jgi:hypothetical protein